MSMKALRKALKSKVEDTFEVGTVIRWTGAGRYTYAAIKAGDGRWYTTAQSYNTYVDQSYATLGALMKRLVESDVTDVAVSTEWASV
jgi:hypothetical protein